MLVRELIEQLTERDPEGEVVVVLFSADGTSSQFAIDAVETENNTIRIEASESLPRPQNMWCTTYSRRREKNP